MAAIAASFDGLGGQAARRAAARLPGGRSGGRRRPARAAVRGPARRRRQDGGYAGLSDVARRPARRRPPRPDRGARPPLDDPPGAVREDAARRLARCSTARSPPSSTSGSPGSASPASSTTAFAAWAGQENLEERVDGDRADRPGRARGAARGDDGLDVDAVRRARVDPALRGARLAPDPPPARHPRLRHQRLHGRGRRRDRRRGARRGRRRRRRPRGALRRHLGQRDASRSADETLDAPAGSLVFISDPALRRQAVAEEAGTLVLAVGGSPGEAVRGLGVGVGASPPCRRCGPGASTRRSALIEDGARASIPATRRCSTTSPAPSRSPDGRTRRSRTCSRPSAPIRRMPARAATDPDFDPIRREPGFPT